MLIVKVGEGGRRGTDALPFRSKAGRLSGRIISVESITPPPVLKPNALKP
jgi:hypothetical protein